MCRKFIKFIPAVLWMILIFWMSSIPDLPSNKFFLLDFIFKKTAHIIEYTVLFLLWFKALGNKNPFQAIIFSIVYAFTDEIHQLFIPGRTGRLRDVGIDSIGMIIFAFLIVKFDLWKLLLSPLPSKKQDK
ncbi:VanZ family protein [bacterium]|nr:MAG: VanZ family protein [bacterium]